VKRIYMIRAVLIDYERQKLLFPTLDSIGLPFVCFVVEIETNELL
jgi:hypothetical protein